MRRVNEILAGKSLDDFLKDASKEQIMELRNSASFSVRFERDMQKIDRETERRSKFIGFLGAVIQECDRHLSMIKLKNKQRLDEIISIKDEYKRFKKLTLEIAGTSTYQMILSKLKVSQHETNQRPS